MVGEEGVPEEEEDKAFKSLIFLKPFLVVFYSPNSFPKYETYCGFKSDLYSLTILDKSFTFFSPRTGNNKKAPSGKADIRMRLFMSPMLVLDREKDLFFS